MTVTDEQLDEVARTLIPRLVHLSNLEYAYQVRQRTRGLRRRYLAEQARRRRRRRPVGDLYREMQRTMPRRV